ncbi:hypothetical protein M885DRAFT_610009 [Pelagophyceae sp. CCMP2097]|nr:hypothetical protein M885DRAFT_610009 [Pelagophyceae sp. CCMP2097]|mmetsp:Transcript_12358/g.43789  ORF Transcript_12358/g.43789 Transcript_12358/m.43789 type:complete len:221 (-) Transcript_12358:490-1152(-)
MLPRPRTAPAQRPRTAPLRPASDDEADAFRRLDLADLADDARFLVAATTLRGGLASTRAASLPSRPPPPKRRAPPRPPPVAPARAAKRKDYTHSYSDRYRIERANASLHRRLAAIERNPHVGSYPLSHRSPSEAERLARFIPPTSTMRATELRRICAENVVHAARVARQKSLLGVKPMAATWANSGDGHAIAAPQPRAWDESPPGRPRTAGVRDLDIIFS